MNKIILLLLFGLLTNDLMSQEIHSEYKFKKEKTKSRFLSDVKWYYRELDSLVLFENGTFFRSYKFNYHEFTYLDYKGNWKIVKDTLVLELTHEKSLPDGNWNEINNKCEFRIKRRKLIPNTEYNINGNYGICYRKLKLIKK